MLRRAVTAQVLIEAKVMEVDLPDEYAAGINWGRVAQILGHTSLGLYPGDYSNVALDPVASGA